MLRILVLIGLVLSGCGRAKPQPLSAFSSTPSPTYEWSENLVKPLPLFAVERGIGASLAAGNYDFECRPIGDNWALAGPGAFTSVKLNYSGTVSVLPRFPVDEPSCGFVILKRGPYADGTPVKNRGMWEMNSLPGGLSWKRASMPIYTHVGARYDRYGTNGYKWAGNGNYPPMDQGYWGSQQPAVGPKLFDPPPGITPFVWSVMQIAGMTRMPVLPSALPPDVTVLSSIPDKPIWVAYTFVDMLGRETEPSDPVQLGISNTSLPGAGTFAIVKRTADAKMGCCGFHVYAGYSSHDLHLQPVLDYQGHEPRYLWPLWCQQFVLHAIKTNTPKPRPSREVRSLLNGPQQQVVAGNKVIDQGYTSYDLYCPFILHYDPENFGRLFTGTAKYTHQTIYQGRALETDIPLLLCQNQDDRPTDMAFTSKKALVGVTTADFSGGQAFGNVLTRCVFDLSGPESYGMLIDERSSVAVGAHTASEMRFVSCTFAGTIPTKIEGNQSAKIRFQEACQFYSCGSDRYPGDTVGVSYQASSNDVHYTQIRGINGNFRSIFCCCALSGQANILATDIFCDAGCPVYITFGSYVGGMVTIRDGERINAPLGSDSRKWARLVEAPAVLGAHVSFQGIRIHPQTSSVSFMLNQLTIDLDQPLGEMVVPTSESWAAKTLLYEYPGPNQISNASYFDFRRKRSMRTASGFSDVPDSVIANPLAK